MSYRRASVYYLTGTGNSYRVATWMHQAQAAEVADTSTPPCSSPTSLFQLALRVPRVRWLFAVTTLTHFWGRYREPQVKLEQLAPPGARRATSAGSRQPGEKTTAGSDS